MALGGLIQARLAGQDPLQRQVQQAQPEQRDRRQAPRTTVLEVRVRQVRARTPPARPPLALRTPTLPIQRGTRTSPAPQRDSMVRTGPHHLRMASMATARPLTGRAA